MDTAGYSRALSWLVLSVPWTPAATLSYLATITLGVMSLRGRRIARPWHTGLFLLTAGLTAIAAALSFVDAWPRGLLLAAALVPLALLPALSRPVAKRLGRHAVLGLAPAPCYLAALVVWAVHAA